MAAVRSKARVDVGSGPWILEERSQIAQFEAQEFEDFTFAARNEIEWLNEHMADIFSENGLNVTEVFKTPGKLRGKTPRTVRKVPGLDSRVPLSNVFSTTSALDRNLAQATKLHGGTLSTDNAIIKTTGQLQTKGRNANADSGYHGLTEDEMDVDQGSLETMPDSMKPHSATQNEVSSPVNVQKLNEQDSDGQRTSEGSFKTAREEATMKLKSVARDSNVDMVSTDQAGKSAVIEESPRDSFVQPKSSESEEIEQEGRGSLLNDNADLEGAQSPSEQSSPAKPLVRKSSLTFASLPAREPLANKKSIGARSSYFNRYTGGKSLGASRPLDATDDGDAEDQMDLDDERPGLAREESDGDGKTARLHNKSSTQRLHERINALGKSQPSRPSKSIPAVIAAAELSYPKLPPRREASTLEHANDIGTKPKTMHNVEEDEDDWIKPSATQQKESKRPFMTKSHTMDVMEQIHGKESVAGQEMGIQIQDQNDLQEEPPFRQSDAPDKSRPGLSHTKSSSVSVLESPSGPPLFRQAELKKAFSVSNPVQAVATGSDKNTKQTSTPAGSPSKIGNDGPLSASKSKLQSIMKSARGLFTSSAGVSAQAKMETCSPSTLRTHDQDQVSLTDAARSGDNARKAVSPQKQPRNTDYHRTGSSTEKEERMREQEAMVRQESQLISSAREQNSRTSSHESEQIRRLPNRTAQEIKRNAISQKPTRQSPRRHQLPESQQEESLTEDLKPHDALQSSNQNQSSQLQKPKDMRRPMKPAKEAASKPKPQPVSIRVGTLSQRIPLTNTALSSSFQESISHSQP
ncbi:hypothetical protein MMC09_000716, partial [Bachmanniomyces sp. S44760]|nr:hypothetical protein [Bachmanniomyces sp. S44760]